MQQIRLSDDEVLISLGLICAGLEAGCTVLDEKDHRFEFFYRLMMVDDHSLCLGENSLEVLKSARTLFKVSEVTGASFLPIFFPILQTRVKGGFCQKASSRTALRAVALAMRSGQSFDEGIQTFLLLTPEYKSTDWPDPVEDFSSYLQEPSFSFFRKWLPLFQEIGADISGLLIFLAGDSF